MAAVHAQKRKKRNGSKFGHKGTKNSLEGERSAKKRATDFSSGKGRPQIFTYMAKAV